MVNQVSKAVGLTHTDASDEVLVGYRNKLNKLESVMTQIKAAYSSFASATIASSGATTQLADVMRTFVASSKNATREAAARAFHSAATSQDAVVAKSYREIFGWEVLKIFDDVNGEIRKLKREIRTVESTQGEVAALETHVGAMRAAKEKKKSAGQALTKDQEAMLASEEEKLTNHRSRAQNLRRQLDESVRRCVEGRYDTLDQCLYRTLELHVEACRAQWNEAQTLQSHIETYRRRVPRSAAPVSGVPPSVGVSNGIHEYDSDEDDDDHPASNGTNGSAVVSSSSRASATGPTTVAPPKHPQVSAKAASPPTSSSGLTPTPPTTPPTVVATPVVVVVTAPPAATTQATVATPPKAAPAKSTDLMDFFASPSTASTTGRSASPAPSSLHAPNNIMPTSYSTDSGLGAIFGGTPTASHHATNAATAAASRAPPPSDDDIGAFFSTGASPKRPSTANAAMNSPSIAATMPARSVSGGSPAPSRASTTIAQPNFIDGFHFPSAPATAAAAAPAPVSNNTKRDSITTTPVQSPAASHLNDFDPLYSDDPFKQAPTQLASLAPRQPKSLRNKALERKAAATTTASKGSFGGMNDGVRVGNDGNDGGSHGGMGGLLGAVQTQEFPTLYSHPDLDPNAPKKEVNHELSRSDEIPRSEMNDEQRAKMQADIANRLSDLRTEEDNIEKEREEMRAVAAQLAPLLDRWEFSMPGVPRNMRTLLSTLHTILWEGARWTTINVSDLMTEPQIKKQHRKALLVVHPDHAARGTVDQRVRAERAFKALDSGMKRYLDEQARTPAQARY